MWTEEDLRLKVTSSFPCRQTKYCVSYSRICVQDEQHGLACCLCPREDSSPGHFAPGWRWPQPVRVPVLHPAGEMRRLLLPPPPLVPAHQGGDSHLGVAGGGQQRLLWQVLHLLICLNFSSYQVTPLQHSICEHDPAHRVRLSVHHQGGRL